MKTQKELLGIWEAYCRELQKATPDMSPHNEEDQDKRKRIAKLIADYDKFVDYYCPNVHRGTPSAPFHLKAAKRIFQMKNIRGVFEWARGHAKSSHMSLMIPIWLMMQEEIKTLVLVGKSQDDAKRMLSKVQANLESNGRIIADFGKQVGFGSWTEGEFTTSSGIKFIAMGRGQSPRGLSSEDSFRPDYIIIDDIDDDELVNSPKRVSKLLDWIKEALFGSMDMGRGRFILVGNRIHKNSVLANVVKMPDIYHTKINALDKNGEVAWQAKYSKKEIEEACKFIGYRASQKEYFNNPIVEGTVFRNEWISWNKCPTAKQMDYIVVYTDPSFKGGANSDYKAVVTLGKKGTKLYVMDCFVRQCSVSAMISYLYDVAETLPETTQYLMEANFTQDAILDEFITEGDERGWQMPISGDYRKKPDKFMRIEAISPIFERALIVFNEAKQKSPDFEKALEQLLSIEKGSSVADDFPDALEGAVFVMNQMRTEKEVGMRIGERKKSKYAY